MPATEWERAADRTLREPDASGAAHETAWLPPGGDAGNQTSAVAGSAALAVPRAYAGGDAPLAHSARCACALLRFFFLLVGLPLQYHQRGVGHQRERHIAIPGAKGTHFILIESHLTLGVFVALFNGLITNDKFCMSRTARLQLSHWRLPRSARQPASQGV